MGQLSREETALQSRSGAGAAAAVGRRDYQGGGADEEAAELEKIVRARTSVFRDFLSGTGTTCSIRLMLAGRLLGGTATKWLREAAGLPAQQSSFCVWGAVVASTPELFFGWFLAGDEGGLLLAGHSAVGVLRDWDEPQNVSWSSGSSVS